jgi:hypothetical protein
MEDLKKGDIIWVRPHAYYSDVNSGYSKDTYNSHPYTIGGLARWLGGEFYRFIHMTNSDTAFVGRLVKRPVCCDDFDLCLVKIKEIIKVP